MNKNSLKVDIEKSFNALFDAVDNQKSPLFIAIQKQLLDGKPLDIETIAKTLCTSVEEAKEIVQQFGETNQEGKVVAFAGVSVIPTPHSFKVNDRQLYTWCAADALIFPSFLNITAEIESNDPISQEPIKLIVNKKTIDFIQPKTAHISWVEDVDTNNIRSTMCRRIHFFVSEHTAKEWQGNNPTARILSVEQLLKLSVNPMDCC